MSNNKKQQKETGKPTQNKKNDNWVNNIYFYVFVHFCF